ncbi:NUDIX domain-containing protein [Candidatus Dependentiae bacterium]|nr:NUDIX domain-containing protein [Candidatus Dependentiae bacterium]
MNTCTVIPYVLAYFTRVYENQEQVLLLYRSNTGFGNNQYGLPGGKINKNETPRQAVIREIKEELGIDVDEKNSILSTFLYFKGASRICMAFVFTITNWDGEPINIEASKHDHLAWYDSHNLPENILPRHALMIKQIQQGIVYAEEGFHSF